MEEILEKLGDRFRELTYHKSSKEWTATGLPENSGDTHAKWKPKRIMCGGKTAKKALEKLYLRLIK